MPHGSRSYYQAGRHPAPHANVRSAATGRLPAELAGDYTFLHAGRQVRLGPVAFWIVVGTLVIMCAPLVMPASPAGAAVPAVSVSVFTLLLNAHW